MEKTNQETVIGGNAVNTASSGTLAIRNFGEDFVFVLKKTERLAAALYAITGFFQDEDPLKWKLRKLGTELLSAGLLLKDGSGDREKGKIVAKNTLQEIGSLLLVAKHAGLISPMNYEVIAKEFAILESKIKVENDVFGVHDKGEFSNEYFRVNEDDKRYKTESEPRAQIESRNENTAHTTPAFIKDNPQVPENNRELLNKEIDRNIYKEPTGGVEKGQKIDESVLAGGHRSHESKMPKPLREFGAVAVKKNSRQSIIIGLLKRKKEIMIKDVSPLIDGVSEKTIQRELLTMVKDGVLKKEGEKRWSKYSLA